MNKKVLRILEYDKIILQLEEMATSLPGKELCRLLQPMICITDISKAQLETADALQYLFKKGTVSFNGNGVLSSCFRSLKIGASLSIIELLQIADLLQCAQRIKHYQNAEQFPKEETVPDSLDPYFFSIEPLSSILDEIRRCILSEEEIADSASSTLRQIRKNISLTNDKVHSSLTSILNGSYRIYLQDAIITMRDNRYCIPVKAEYKNQVPGMIHDQSSSGSTLFIEPSSIVSLNNTLRELELAEKEEIAIILATLSDLAATKLDALIENTRVLSLLDFIFAKAKLALEYNATVPHFNDKKEILIRKGRHPLLPKKTVVPIDIQLGKDFDLLIVTGPNTGGKTVSLKTVGLLTLMGQSGLHIPASDNSTLSCFNEVFADIGDEQSIEQSLSTFSSHMTNIVTILKESDENSLCLFDELGAGTDPTEGAALAISILTYLHGKGIRTMATTHYSELKVFALTTPFVENACCEFDVASLRPTYRLLIGIPGKSNAFAISQKLGLPLEIIEGAKSQISEDDQSFEDLLTDLEHSRITIENEHREIASYKDRVKTLEQQLKDKKERMEQSKDKILRAANEEARELLQEAKNTYDEAIKVLQNTAGIDTLKELESRRRDLRENIANKNSSLSAPLSKMPSARVSAKELTLGTTVKVHSMGIEGTIISLPDAKNMVNVQCGILRSLVAIDDLSIVPNASNKSSVRKYQAGGKSLSKSNSMSMEINLLGKTVDEAIGLLEKYIDDAYLSSLPTVRIVHGKGTGALRKAVHSKLKTIHYVKSYRLGEFGEGDSGVTIVEFK